MQHKTVKDCSCKKLKNASSHHSHQHWSSRWWAPHWAEQEGHRSAILAILLIQISRCLQIEKNCDATLQFQAQEREIHQYRYHWTPCRLPCEPCTYEYKKMELCLQIQPNFSVYFGGCICNHRCLAERCSSAERNLLRLEEIFNLRCIEAIYCPMPKPCLGRFDLENYPSRAGAAKVFSQSFFCTASEWIQSGLFNIPFCDDMFSSKAACMISTVSLTTFSGNTRFRVPIQIWFEEPSCTKPSILLSGPNFQNLSPGMQPMK